ncbi:MAG TPA: 2-phospho-L-lactate transferase CofD family protein [Roseiflexaceae bacterium]|jgi:uncharacterized cofD-like protein|nr:2-phospho-L-lactate transferase CofD family protein [Roseiflexaceae bacterium]
MQAIFNRLSSLKYLLRPLALVGIGIVLLSLGLAYFVVALYHTVDVPDFFYYVTLQFLPRWTRGFLLGGAGLAILIAGIWQLSSVVVISLTPEQETDGELLVGYRQLKSAPFVTVLSGGSGMLVLAGLGRDVRQLVCVTPIQDPVEYYYRAASLLQFENVIYVPPSPAPVQVFVELDDGSRHNIRHDLTHNDQLTNRHVQQIYLADDHGQPCENVALPLLRQASEAIANADAIILGPGSLFASIIPNLLIPEVREAIKRSKARKIYICNLMTEPALTTGFNVAEHIRQIKRYGQFTPDYVLVDVQRIEPAIRRLYEAANQVPVQLTPEEYEETMVPTTDRVTTRSVVVEGAEVIEADLASTIVQVSATLDRPGESRAVRVLRHDPEKVTGAILEVLRRT